ncbi:MAG TPA: LD-carboxypeptidase [Ferruginibacter sp.]|nr:LD-carboxypeptidase [Ferruginibacter sp.]HRE62691.1 LD-carboxypeptidase [Ferruginibacter sp.]
MKRKHFLSSFGVATLAAGSLSFELAQTQRSTNIPPYLKKGDTIGITSPAGYITISEIQSAFGKIQEWGFKIKMGDTIGKRAFTFGGTDEERKNDLQQMLDDPNVKAILCARGGYGLVRIIDQLDFTKFKSNPKWVIGFSDITVLHSHIQNNFGIASIHSKMCNSFPDDWAKAEPIQIETIQSIADCLKGKQMSYTALPNAFNKPGQSQGILVGGNLKTIESLSASNSDLNTDGKILFVEDTMEKLYSIDRMFWNLKRSGKLSKLAGLIVGGFRLKQDDTGDEFGFSIGEIVSDKIKEFNYPVCFDFPVGHQKNNFALKCGVGHRLTINEYGTFLTANQ